MGPPLFDRPSGQSCAAAPQVSVARAPRSKRPISRAAARAAPVGSTRARAPRRSPQHPAAAAAAASASAPARALLDPHLLFSARQSFPHRCVLRKACMPSLPPSVRP